MGTVQRIQFGVSHRALNLLGPLAAREQNEEEGISLKHWILVFTPPSKSFAFTFEANRSNDGKETICMPVRYHPGSQNALPLGTFYGEWDDLIKILEVHPQRGSKYSPCFNNCQHFVATFLLLLRAFVNITPNTWIEIEEPARYAKINEVLKSTDGIRIWNASNMAMGRVMFMPIPLAGVATAGAVFAAETTVATTVASTAVTTVATTISAGGVAGWLGATTTVLTSAVVPVTQTIMVPAAYSSFAAFCAPLALGCAALAGAAYVSNREKWKRSTGFSNPLVCGFPIRLRGPLTVKEYYFPTSSQDGKSLLFSGSPAIADAKSFDCLNGMSIPPEIDAVGASSLHRIAHGIFGPVHQARDTGSFFMFF